MPEPEDTPDEQPQEQQEQLGDAGKKALEAEREARKSLEKQLREATKAREALDAKVREFEDRDKSDIEKRDTRIKELEAALAESNTALSRKDIDILRRDVAREKNVPISAVTGDTKEEMEAAADALLEWRGTKPSSNALRSGASAPDGANEKQKAAAALRGLRRD